ncbi:MAG: AAA family ATPase [Candidatus Woesearchaeota archaeon]|nr:MAG: AAA family ATPase [Candidatus Woesearchaeota archaeon]
MLLKKIRLKNIRSYMDQTIEFPLGSLLLSGDIGSGKSSVLLALDFALFGLQPGTLTGSALLRNGEKRGEVEINFVVDNKEVIVKRSLKRTSYSIVQDEGYVEINGQRQPLTPVEIKQMVLDLLNYPSELLTKSKDLIYRYTVYTPQEEMKHILLDKREARIDTLRKVFGIDKYKRMKENVEIVIKALKEKRRELAGMIIDLEDKKLVKKEKEIILKELEKSLYTIEKELIDVKKETDTSYETLKGYENKIEEYVKLKHELELLETNLHLKISTHSNYAQDLQNIELEILDLKDSIKGISEDLTSAIEEKQKKLQQIRKDYQDTASKIKEFEVKFEGSDVIINQVKDLNECPVCLQKVSQDHKSLILEKETSKKDALLSHLEKHKKKEEELKKELENLEKEINSLLNKNYEFKLTKLKKENLKEKEQRLDRLKEQEIELKKQIEEITNKKPIVLEKLESLRNIEADYKLLKKDYEDKKEALKQQEIKYAALAENLKYIQETINEIQTEISRKELFRDKLNNYGVIQEWLEETFINLLDVMEKKVLLKVNSDFGSLLEKWFSILVNNEELRIRLDEEFTPLINQAGHEIDYLYLSGGEKTAAALAYRLALNQVINNLVSTIKTRDLLILDEPTDGFSEEQLDSIRAILDELNIKQVIIVSHESKIESFVDKVIKFKKEGHVSSVEVL